MSDTTNRIRVEKINYFEDFEEGQTFEHHWGRTINDGDNSLFSTLTVNSNPMYFNEEYARDLGYDGIVLNHMLAFNVVFGMSVQDLSEAGGAFLGIDDLIFYQTVEPGVTLYAESEVIKTRKSDSRPHQGIVTWHTKGRTGDGNIVLEYNRSNLIDKRNPPENN